MTNVTSLVQTNGQQAFTTSLIIAEGCDNRSHESTIKLIRKHQALFENLGQLDFKSNSLSSHTGGKLTEYAILNEDQATFLITLFRNTPTVLSFKLNLVKAFRTVLNEIARLYAAPPPTSLPPLPPPPPTRTSEGDVARTRARLELMRRKTHIAQLEHDLAVAKLNMQRFTLKSY